MNNNIEKILVVGLLFAHHPNLDIGGAQSDIYDSLQSPNTSVVPTDVSASQKLHDNLSSREDNESDIVTISDPEILPTINTITTPTIEHKSSLLNKKKNRDEVAVSSYSTKDMLSEKSLSSDSTQPDKNSSVSGDKIHASVSLLDTAPSPKNKEIIKIDNKKYFSPVVDSIVVPSRLIKFDVNYVKKQVYSLLASSYSVEKGELIFHGLSDDKRKEVYDAMDNVRKHLKQKNTGLSMFIGKGKIRNYVSDQKNSVYKILLEDNKLQYKGGEEKFKNDFQSLIDIYK